MSTGLPLRLFVTQHVCSSSSETYVLLLEMEWEHKIGPSCIYHPVCSASLLFTCVFVLVKHNRSIPQPTTGFCAGSRLPVRVRGLRPRVRISTGDVDSPTRGGGSAEDRYTITRTSLFCMQCQVCQPQHSDCTESSRMHMQPRVTIDSWQSAMYVC